MNIKLNDPYIYIIKRNPKCRIAASKHHPKSRNGIKKAGSAIEEMKTSESVDIRL